MQLPRNFAVALTLAAAAGADAANRRADREGRTTWSDADFDHAADTCQRTLAALGFDFAREGV